MSEIVWVFIVIAAFTIVGAAFLFVSFIRSYYGTWYEYKGKRYRLIRTVDCKDRTTRMWYSAALYKNEEGQVFCRPMKEFTERFVPVKRNR